MTESTAHIIEIFVTILTSVLASSGFWLVVTKKLEGRDSTRQLLMGLAHDRIVYLCMKYIARGSITQDEYENLEHYLFRPYSKIGGNGTVNRLMQEVNKLPLLKTSPKFEKEIES